jgi:Icc-related predicted phosphoesterase
VRIAVLTDIHGTYAVAIEIVRYAAADVVVIGGDLTTVGSVREAEAAIDRFTSVAPVLFCIAGNMDLPQHDQMYERKGISLNGHGVVLGDVGIFGVSAAPLSTLHTTYERTENELLEEMEHGYADVRNAAKKILISHAPPYGSRVDIIHAGYHVGSTAVRDFIEDRKPDVVACGHIHEGRGSDTIGTTVIINCGPAFNGYYGLITTNGGVKVENSFHSPGRSQSSSKR